MHVIVEPEKLLVEGGIVGEDAGGVVVDFEAVGDGFDDDGFSLIVDDPMEVGGRKFSTEGDVGEVNTGKESASFTD